MVFRKSLCHIGFTVSGIIACFLMISIFPSMVFEHSVWDRQKIIGRGSVRNLKRAYERWVAEYASLSSSGPAINLVWNKGLSSEFTKAKGIAKINMEDGSVNVRIRGCDDNRISEVWLVDNVAGLAGVNCPNRATKSSVPEVFNLRERIPGCTER